MKRSHFLKSLLALPFIPNVLELLPKEGDFGFGARQWEKWIFEDLYVPVDFDDSRGIEWYNAPTVGTVTVIDHETSAIWIDW